MAKEYEVVIIGAGIMGSTAAYYLSKHYGGPGKVLLLEQFDWLHRRGSSHGESRIIRRTYKQDHYTFLMEDAYKLWSEAEKEANTKVFIKTGGLDFCKEDGQIIQSLIAGSTKHNVPFEILDAKKLKERFPMINLPSGFVVMYSPDSGLLKPNKSLAMFQTLARMNGCELRDNCDVVKIEDSKFENNQSVKIILGKGEEILTKKCIIVAGSWTGKLLKENFDLHIPLEVLQSTVAYWKVDNPSEYSSKNFPIFISYDGPLVYGTPIQEYPNLIKCCPYGGTDCDPNDRDFIPNSNLIEERAAQFLKNNFKGVNNSKPTLTESCMVTYTPDEDFIIDVLPSNPNIIIGCGFSGHGFKLGPVVGKMLSEISINGQHSYPDLQKFFELSRFK